MVRGSQDCAILNNDEPRLTLFRITSDMSYEIVEVPDENPDTVGNDSNSFLENPHDSDRNSQDNENSMAESIIVDSADLSQGTLSNSILEVPDSVDLDPPNVDQVEIQRFGQETYFQLTKCMELTTAAEELTSELCTKFANDPNANYDNINTPYWFDYFIRCKPQKMHLLAIEFITTNKNSASNL